MKKISTSLKALINILNDNQYHSGAALGELIGISRNAVWKYINQLIKLGIEIESAQSVGYRFKYPIILLDAKELKKHIHPPQDLGINKLEIVGSIPSTMNYFKDYATEDKKINICLAEHQSSGRGRFGRYWHSPFASNIYFSCFLSIPKDVSTLSGLSLVVSLAIVSALKSYGLQELRVKWPNDVLWKGKKLAGNLIEMNAESHGNTKIIIGVGLNVNMHDDSNLINQPWTSLNQILQTVQDRNRIAGLLIHHLLIYLNLFFQNGFEGFLAEWRESDFLIGKQIELYSAENLISGIAAGVDEYGRLLLKQENVKLPTAHSAGETSLLK